MNIHPHHQPVGKAVWKTISKSCPAAPFSSRNAGFTMVEIAICLAIMGLALVSIIGALPRGMNVQRDNREETIINQDSTVILESIRGGVNAGTDLTNYIYAITNYTTPFNGTKFGQTVAVGFGYSGASYGTTPYIGPQYGITNNARIIGLLSTPEFTYAATPGNFVPAENLLGALNGGTSYSNRVYAFVHSMSGPAVEKPPQNSDIMIGDSFTYRVLVVNAPPAQDTNLYYLPTAQQKYSHELAQNLHELRLTFAWPVRANGLVSSDGPVPQTQRTMIAGTVTVGGTNIIPNQALFYYQSQFFNNSP